MRSLLSDFIPASRKLALVSAFAGIIAASLIAVSDTSKATEMSDTANHVTVRVDEARIIRLDRPAKRIVLGNPAIADVAAQSNSLLVLTGKSFGHTNVIALDENNDEIFNSTVNVQLTSTSAITLHRGAERFSYACAPFCQSQLVMGDEKKYYEKMGMQIQQKFNTISEVMSGHNK